MSDSGHRRGEGIQVGSNRSTPSHRDSRGNRRGLPVFPYTWHMLLHIVGAVSFLGNLIVTAGWMTWAVGQKDSRVAAVASAGVNKADRWFRSPGMILLLLNGLAMPALAW